MQINPMTGKPLPPIQILETAAAITNAEIDGDEKISAWLTEREVARLAWHAAITAFDRVRFMVEGLADQIAAAEADAAEAERQRPEAIALAMLAGSDPSAADALLVERRDASMLRAERLRLARIPLDTEARRLNALVGQAASPLHSFEEMIEERREALKLALAERRCA